MGRRVWNRWPVVMLASITLAGACVGKEGPVDGSKEGDQERAALSITSVSPGSLPHDKGGELTIFGAGFDEETTLTVAGVALEPEEIEEGRIIVSLPARSRGGQAIIEVTRGEQVARWDDFRFDGIPASALRFIGQGFTERALTTVTTIPGQPSLLLARGPRGVGSYRVEQGVLSEEVFYKDEAQAGMIAACVFDLDADGEGDLFMVSPQGEGVTWEGSGPGLFTPPAPEEPGDGEPPMEGEGGEVGPEVVVRQVACDTTTGELVLYIGASVDGREVLSRVLARELTPASIAAGVITPLAARAKAILPTHIDGDGQLDLILHLEGSAPSIWYGDGERLARAAIGTTPEAGVEGRAFTMADIDEDGDRDLLFATPAGVGVWMQEDGAFLDISREVAGANVGALSNLLARDLDRDGRVDLITSGGAGSKLLVGGDFKFFDASGALLPAGVMQDARSFVAMDADGDGDEDVVFVDGDKIALMINWAPAAATDSDGDGLPDEVDVCPEAYDPAQGNRDAHPFLCERRSVCERELGCEVVDGGFGTLYLVCDGESKRTRNGARDFCESRNARLLRLEGEPEQALFAERIKGRFWLEPKDAAMEGTWVHDDGSEAPYTGWLENQPDNAGDGEHCAEIISEEERLGWNDLPCDRERAVICEVVPLTGAPDPGDACDVCPDVYDPEQRDGDGDGVGDACASEGGE